MDVPVIRSVICVHPDPDLGALISETMQDFNSTVSSVSTGWQATAMMSRHRYDLALINATLPDMPAIRVAEHAANENVPVVLLSGHSAVLAEFARRDLPFLAKPFSLEELRDASERAMRDSEDNIRRVRASAGKMLALRDGLTRDLAETRRNVDALLQRLNDKRRD